MKKIAVSIKTCAAVLAAILLASFSSKSTHSRRSRSNSGSALGIDPSLNQAIGMVQLINYSIL